MHDSTTRRLDRLERRTRWLAAALATAVAALALLGAGASSPDAVRATSIQLVDGEGRTRAAVELRDGQPVVALLDEAGVERLRLVHDADQTGLFVQDGDGVTRLGAAQFAHGGGGFALHGPASKGAAVLYLKGDGSLRFFDAEGRVTARVPAEPGSPAGDG